MARTTQLAAALLCSMTLVTLLTCLSSPAVGAPAPPVWDSQFYVTINQTITIKLEGQWKNTVRFWYDATRAVSKEEHSSGQHDEFCTAQNGKSKSQEACTHLVAADSWRYLIFPESNICCRCCNVTQHCGIILPTWLQGGSYVGTMDVNGRTCDGWVKDGGQHNYYYQDSAGAPCLYYEGYPTLLVGKNEWLYNLDYQSGPQAVSQPGLFDVPPNCSARCDNKFCELA